MTANKEEGKLRNGRIEQKRKRTNGHGQQGVDDWGEYV